MPAGRPTDYDPAICDQIVDKMSEGLSLTAACAELGFWRQRAYEWAERHEELADALKMGKGKRVAFLERRLMKEDFAGPAMTGTIFALKNADPEEWRDKVTNEQTGNVTVEIVKLTDG